MKTSSVKKVHEKTEAAEDFLEKKSLEKLRKQNLSDTSSIDVEEIVIPAEKRQQILNGSGKCYKMNITKYLIL